MKVELDHQGFKPRKLGYKSVFISIIDPYDINLLSYLGGDSFIPLNKAINLAFS